MNIIEELVVEQEPDENLKKAELENGFYNIVDGEKISTSKRLSVNHGATNKQLATVPDVEHALLAIAISVARNAFFGMGGRSVRTPESNTSDLAKEGG
jgi:hypothetical protein